MQWRRKGWDARLATSPNRSNLGVVRIWARSITQQTAFSAPRNSYNVSRTL